MAKRTSKRVSERRKTKTAFKNARKEIKLRKIQEKRRKAGIKVPRSHLMTDAELEMLKNIKEATERRNSNIVEVEKQPEFLAEVERCIFEKKCDGFIEVVDFRDLEGSRNIECEELIRRNGGKVYVFVRNVCEWTNLDLSRILGKNLILLEDFSVLANFKKFCIFGNPKIGKFLLSKAITDKAIGRGGIKRAEEPEFVFVRTPVKQGGLSGLLRGYVDLKNINPLAMFELFWKCVDSDVIREYYMVGRFDSYESFLDLLAEKLRYESGRGKTHSDAALHVFKDVLCGKIGWIKVDDKFDFKFEQSE